MFDLIIGIFIGVIIGFFSGYLSGIAVARTQRRWDKSDKKKEDLLNKLNTHKINLINNVLKKLKNAEIRCDEFHLWRTNNFRVWIKGLEESEGKKIYKQAIQHLEAYPDIYKLWNSSIKKIYRKNGLNDVLKELKKYLSEKINKKFKTEWNRLHSSIWCIIEGTKPSYKIKDSKDLYKYLDEINITIKGKTVYVDSSDRKTLAIITCKEKNVNDVKDFLSDLIKKDITFRENVNNFMMEYKELKKTFEKDFKNKFNALLQDIEGEEEKLKGNCDFCN